VVDPPSIIEILYAIRDVKSLKLFNTLAIEDGKTQELISKLCISRKEFYSRIMKLLKVGMIKCVGGKYSLTVFGRAIYEVQILLAMAVHNYGKLKNLDSISLLNEASVDERFVDNIEIKILS
jgi:predicted transcriptional regulator